MRRRCLAVLACAAHSLHPCVGVVIAVFFFSCWVSRGTIVRRQVALHTGRHTFQMAADERVASTALRCFQSVCSTSFVCPGVADIFATDAFCRSHIYVGCRLSLSLSLWFTNGPATTTTTASQHVDVRLQPMRDSVTYVSMVDVVRVLACVHVCVFMCVYLYAVGLMVGEGRLACTQLAR